MGDQRYAILFGGFLLLRGRLADVLGRRRLFVAGLALFTASSFLSGLAWSETSLIAFRGVQGPGGALLAPAALSILMTTFSEGARGLVLVRDPLARRGATRAELDAHTDELERVRALLADTIRGSTPRRAAA